MIVTDLFESTPGVTEALGDNRPKLGSKRDQGKSVRKWRQARRMDESGVAEGHNNSKTIITEALIAQKLWENAGRKLMEAQLTADQITQIFQQIQQDATAAGGNRTLIGKGKDAAGAVSAAWTNLKDKIYNSKPMTGFAAQYDKAAEKLKQATGGDAGAMKYIQKYRDFATKHPVLQSAIYAALIAAAGISGVGLAGAAALGLFKLVDQAIQGKDIRSAAWSGVKAGATAYAAGQIGQAFKDTPTGGGTDVSGFGIEQGLSSEQIQTLKDLGASGKKMVIQGGELWYEGPNGLVMFTTPDGSSAEAMLKVAQGAGDLSGTASAAASAVGDVGPRSVAKGAIEIFKQKVVSGEVTDYNSYQQAMQDAVVQASKVGAKTASLQSQQIAQRMLDAQLDGVVARAAGGEFVGSGPEKVGALIKALGGTVDQASLDRAASAVKSMATANAQSAASQAASNATFESKKLSESQIFFVIGKIVERQRKLDEGIMDTIKGAAGKAMNYAKTKGTNLTTKITADKLLQAWKKAKSPTDSETVAKVMQSAGVPATSVQQVYSAMKIPFDAAPAEPEAAPASGPGDPTPLLSPAQLAAKRDPTAAAPAAAPVGGAERQSYAGMKDDGTPYSNDELRKEFFPTAPDDTAADDTAAAPDSFNPFKQIQNQLQNYGTSTGGRVTGTATGLRHTANPNNPNAVAATTSTPAAAAATTTATTTKPAAAAAGKFPGEDPQGSNYVGRREVARRQAARDADAAKKPATPNFGGPAGYSSTSYAPNIKTGISLPKPAAGAAPTKTPTQAEKDAYVKSIGAPAMAENRIATALKKPVAEMLQMVETKEDVAKIKQFVDQTFVKYGAVNESAFVVRNQILEHVTQVGAQRRRDFARKS
jgi:hypothetical protein